MACIVSSAPFQALRQLIHLLPFFRRLVICRLVICRGSLDWRGCRQAGQRARRAVRRRLGQPGLRRRLGRPGLLLDTVGHRGRHRGPLVVGGFPSHLLYALHPLRDFDVLIHQLQNFLEGV